MEFLPIIIDLVLVFILISSIFDGRKKGFVKMALSIVATIVGLIVAKEYAEPVALWINEAFVHDGITESIANAISASIGSGADAIVDALPDYIVRAAEAGGVTADSILDGMDLSVGTAQLAEHICVAVENVFIINAIKLVAFFIIYAICNAILGIGISIVDRFFRLPILKGLNRLLGSVLGGIKGVFVVCIVSAIIGLVTLLLPANEFTQAVEQTNIQSAVWQTLISMFN